MVAFTPRVQIQWDGGSWTDETARCKHISIARGRGQNLEATEVGTCTLTMVDTDGRYNPLNTSSPLYGYTNKVRAVNIDVTYNSTRYYLYYGATNRVESNGDRSVQAATISCVDTLWALNRNLPTIASSTTTVREAIGAMVALLAAEGPVWDLGYLYYRDGDTVTFSADGTVSAVQHTANLLTTDRGTFFINRGGQPAYYDRYIFNHPDYSTVRAALVGTMAGIAPGWDAETVRNRATVTKTGGTAQTKSDSASIAIYGGSDYTPITSSYLASDAAAASLAQYLVNQRKDGVAPVRYLTLTNGDDVPYTALLARELFDRVTVNEAWGNTAFDGHIMRITHEIDCPSATHFGRWGLVKRDAIQPFLIGISTIGSTTDLIAY